MLAGYMMTLGMSITLSLTFVTAYFGGTFSTLVRINQFGEAHVELILVCFVTLLGFVGLYSLFKIIPPRVAC